MTTDTDTDTLTSLELAERAGVTYRQLDSWCRHGIVTPCTAAHGSGTRRAWPVDLVPLVRVLGVVSLLGRDQGQGGRAITADALKLIVDAYDDGHVEVGPGVWLTWRVEP